MNEQDRWEFDLHENYLDHLAEMDARQPISLEQRRRYLELCSYRCPDHGCDLEECEETDETGAHVFYRCPIGDHHFGSAHDAAGGYFPVDDEIGVVRIERCDG